MIKSFERFTDRARRVLVLAQDIARQKNLPAIDTDVILAALLRENDGVAAQALKQLGVNVETIEAAIPVGHFTGTAQPFTDSAKKALEYSLREALQLGHNYIGTEHMLLGLLRLGEGKGVEALNAQGANTSVTRQQILRLLGTLPSPPTKTKTEKQQLVYDVNHWMSRVESILGEFAQNHPVKRMVAFLQAQPDDPPPDKDNE